MAPIANNQAPWYIGHGVGATNFTRHEAQRFARQLLESADYRQSLEARIKNSTLPPAVETMLWHYAFGKPIEQVQVQVTADDLSHIPAQELVKRYQERLQELQEAAEVEEALPAEFKASA